MVVTTPNKAKKLVSPNIDISVLEELNDVLSSSNLNVMAEFVSAGKLNRVLKSWSFFASVNDHNHFVEITVNLARVASAFSHNGESLSNKSVKHAAYEQENVQTSILAFYTEIIDEHLKVVYRALTNNRASITNPMLRLLMRLLEFKSSLVSHFLESFDMNLSVLPRLLVPSKQEKVKGVRESSKDYLSVRYNFIKFWIVLNARAPTTIRKELLIDHSRIMNNLWKYVAEVDSTSTILMLIDFLNNNVLDDAALKKSTKCKILNENFMFKVQPLFLRYAEGDVADELMSFFLKVSNDPINGLVYKNDSYLVIGTSMGVSIHFNNRSFKICNKILFSLLNSLKPRESYNQLQLAVSILEASPELVSPYMHSIIQRGGGYHDPSLTSFWLGHTLLYSKVINSTSPESALSPLLAVKGSEIDYQTLADHVVLPPLLRSALTKCIEFKSNIVRQLSLQILVFSLKKLGRILALNTKIDRQEFIEKVITRVPDLSILVVLYNEITKDTFTEENKILLLTLTMIFTEYEKLFTKSSFSSVSNSLSRISNSGINNFVNRSVTNLSGFDIFLLDNYLSIQFNQQQEHELKWWNSQPNGYSFFTILVRLAAKDDLEQSVSWKVYKILESLTQGQMVFGDRLVVSPIIALIQSLKIHSSSNDDIWGIIDEAIGRAVRSPYKYLDVSHKLYGDVNLFSIVLLEQTLYFLRKDKISHLQSIVDWIFIYLKYLVIIGEPKIYVLKLEENYLRKEPIIHNVSTYKGLKDLMSDEDSLSDQKGNSFSSIILSLTPMQLAKEPQTLGGNIPISRLDFVTLLFKIKSIIVNSGIQDIDDSIVTLFVILGDYIRSVLPGSRRFKSFVLSKFFWGEILRESFISSQVLSTKEILCANLFNHILRDLSSEIVQSDSSSSKDIKGYLKHAVEYVDKLPQNNQLVISRFMWLLDSSDLNYLVEKVNPENDILTLRVLELVCANKLSVSFSTFRKALYHDSEYVQGDQKSVIMSNLLDNYCVHLSEEEWKGLLVSSLDSFNLRFLFRPLVSYLQRHLNKCEEFLFQKLELFVGNDDLILFVASSVISSGYYTNNSRHFGFFKSAFQASLKKINNQNSDSKDTFKQKFNVILHSLRTLSLSSEVLRNVVQVILSCSEGDAFECSIDKTYVSVMIELFKRSDFYIDVSQWLRNSILYITKVFSEANELAQSFVDFLIKYRELCQTLFVNNSSLWQLINPSFINAQLEAILAHPLWVQIDDVLQYSSVLIMSSNMSQVNYQKLLQIFLNNKEIALKKPSSEAISRLRFQSSVIISNLYYQDPKKIPDRHLIISILQLYSGSVRAEDIVLKQLLIHYEKLSTKTWVSEVSDWNVMESIEDMDMFQDEKLISGNHSRLVISLNRSFISNTSMNFRSIKNSMRFSSSLVQNLSSASLKNMSCYEEAFKANSQLVDQAHSKTIYDPEFVLLLILNSEEFVKFDQRDKDKDVKPKINVRAFLDSGLLSLVVLSLGLNGSNVSEISKILVANILNSIPKSDRDANIFTVYVSNILFTLRVTDSSLPPLVWSIYGSLGSIISNPGHFLFEKTCRYLLSHPKCKTDEIPLKAAITSGIDNENSSDTYFKEVTWFLEQLINGIQTSADLTLLRDTGTIQWVLDLLNLPQVLYFKLRFSVLKVLYVITNIDEGSDILVTRYAILSFIEQHLTASSLTKLDKYGQLQQEQLALNLKQISLRMASSLSSSKRIRQWSKDDLPRYVKRVHRES